MCTVVFISVSQQPLKAVTDDWTGADDLSDNNAQMQQPWDLQSN